MLMHQKCIQIDVYWQLHVAFVCNLSVAEIIAPLMINEMEFVILAFICGLAWKRFLY